MSIDHEAVPFINSITVTPLLPLYTVEKGIRKCQFDSNGMVIYSADAASKSTRVPAVALARSSTFMKFDVRNLKPGTNPEPFVLRGFFRAIPAGNCSSWENTPVTIEIDPTVGDATFQPHIDLPTKYLPTGLEGNIEWTVTLKSDYEFQNPLSAFKTPVSFYCLHPDVPKYISDGLPAKLLQILLLTTYSGIGDYTDDYQGWVKYGMEFLRRQHFRYETLGGAYSYCEDPNDNGMTTTCYLEHWLAHYYALLDETNVDRQRRVNCYDLATLGQVMLAVGLDASPHKLRMKFLAPFGMIKPTSLIGFPGKDNCNNPFFEDGKTDPLWDTNPLWTEEHGKYRSGFRNHAFLSVTDGSQQNIEQVIDATCGPQIATLTLEEYVDAAIDHEASKTLKFTETSGGHKAGNLISTDGDVTKIMSGDGVTRISSPVDVQQYPGNKPTSGLLYAINTAASSGEKFPAGKLIGPSVHTDGMVLNINWMFTPEKDTNVPSIDMTVYSSKGNQLNLEYINRKARFDDADNDLTDIKALYDAKELSKTVVKGVVQLEPGANEPYALWQQGLTGANDEALGMIVMVTGFAQDDLKLVVKTLMDAVDEELADTQDVGTLKVTCWVDDDTKDDQPLVVSRGSSFDVKTECTVEVSAVLNLTTLISLTTHRTKMAMFRSLGWTLKLRLA